jgi:hypothetical protein
MKFRAPPLLLAASLCLLPRLPAQTALQPGADTTTALQPGSDATTALAPPPQIYGKVEGDYYTSPTGIYKVRIPVLPQLGGSISDTPNVATFDDDFSTHISIGAFPLSRELKWEYDTRGAKDFLVYFFTSLVMPDFAARFPGSKMEDNAAFLPKFQDGSLLIFTLLPGGSFFAQRVTLGSAAEPLVAKRGNLCFVKYNCVFVVSTELSERVLEHSTYHKTTEEENATLRQRLLDIVGKMQFTQPPPETKN